MFSIYLDCLFQFTSLYSCCRKVLRPAAMQPNQAQHKNKQVSLFLTLIHSDQGWMKYHPSKTSKFYLLYLEQLRWCEKPMPLFPTKHDITEIYCHVFVFSATVGGKFPGPSFRSAQKVHLMQVLGTFRGSQQCWWLWLVTQIYSNNTRVTTTHKSKTKAVPLLSFLSFTHLHLLVKILQWERTESESTMIKQTSVVEFAAWFFSPRQTNGSLIGRKMTPSVGILLHLLLANWITPYREPVFCPRNSCLHLTVHWIMSKHVSCTAVHTHTSHTLLLLLPHTETMVSLLTLLVPHEYL